ncbi:MAG: hypothetical protein CFE31_14345 [Rhizobiales bacterium PAR1]|nr:MAG: hypothetical protein CFE31_14345 [Rhizobiales bacterium PAR1]
MVSSITNSVKASPAAVKARQRALITYMLKFQKSALSNLQDMLYSSVETPTGLSGLFAQPSTSTTTATSKATTSASVSSLKQGLNIKA